MLIRSRRAFPLYGGRIASLYRNSRILHCAIAVLQESSDEPEYRCAPHESSAPFDFNKHLGEASGALALKCFDSRSDGTPRFARHTAFVDPTAPVHAAPRISIEVRTLVFHRA